MKTITFNPETHKLVPVEPTPEMRAAALSQFTLPRIWDAMLAAAPEAPEQAGTQQVPHSLAKWAGSPELVETGNDWQQGYENARAWVHVQLTANAADPQQGEREAEHDSKDRRCECCGYMTYHREHLGCIRAAARAHQPPPAKAEGQEQRSEDEPVAWGFHNTALTGRNRWMMLREQVPENDQYGGAMWTPLYAAPQPAKDDNWQQYAKPGETAQQCIERHRAEQDALMTLLAQARAEQAAKAAPSCALRLKLGGR